MYKIEVDSKYWTIRELVDMHRAGVLLMDIPIQRGIVWDNAARSLYVHSALLGILTVQPPFVFSRRTLYHEDGSVYYTYSVLDGKQRLTTLLAFINEDFKLTRLQDQPGIEDQDLTGFKYTELPVELMQQLQDTNILCTVVSDPTPEQEEVIFARLNNNKSMSSVDKIRPQCKATQVLVNFISSHSELFSLMFSEKQLAKKPEFEIVIKMLMMLQNEPGLSSAQMMTFAKNLDSNPNLAELDYVCTRAQKLYTKLADEELPSFLKNKAVFLALVPYLNNKKVKDDALAECIRKLMTERLDEFKTGSAHSPTAATVEERRNIVDSCF